MQYEIIKDPDEPYYGEVSELPGVWANAKALETCRENLKEVVEGWILLSIMQSDLPAFATVFSQPPSGFLPRKSHAPRARPGSVVAKAGWW